MQRSCTFFSLVRALCAVAFFAIFLPLPSAIAQCRGSWEPGLGTPGPNGEVYAVVRLPNGDIIAGGLFDTASDAFCSNIARWNGMSWSSLGEGTNGAVRALLVLANGDLLAAGQFDRAGGTPARNIARWDGSSWRPLGPGLGSPVAGRVNALVQMPNGDVIAGGGFGIAGTLTVRDIARWDGRAWNAINVTGEDQGEVNAMALLPNGSLVVGGGFGAFEGISNTHLVRWDGSSWYSMAPPPLGDQPY